MNKKILFLIWVQVCLLSTALFAQPCTGTTDTCIADQHISFGSTDWHTSHGVLAFSSNNAPTSPSTSQSLRMHSILGQGSGAFTCYKFVQGKTYRVCFWVRNVSGWPGNFFGRLYVYAANNLVDNPPGPPNVQFVPVAQLIDQSYLGPGSDAFHMDGTTDWEFISTTFTAHSNLNCFWVYPLNTAPLSPPGPIQYNDDYIVEVDDIRITEEPATPYSLSVSDNTGNLPIDGCSGSAQITISGLPAGAVATWTPAVTVPNPTGSVVIAQPCSTTTYKIEIADTTSNCGKCIREVLYHTIWVNQWSDPALINYPTAVVSCTDSFHLSYNDPGTCAAMAGWGNYIWTEPDGVTTHTGKSITITNANAYQTGEWTLSIWNSNKGCTEEHKFNITVGSCCISTPDFTFTTGVNPVNFTNTGTGITNHVSTLWSFGDGATSDVDNPIHTYDLPGSYTVCMTTLYQDGQGQSCCNRKCQTIQVPANSHKCKAAANFNYNAIPGWGNTFDFTDASTGSGTICRYQWDFGDTTKLTTTVPMANHNYTTPGPWNVCLTVTNCVYDAQGNLIDSCISKKCRLVNPVMTKTTPGQQDAARSLPGRFVQVALPGAGADDNVLIAYPNPNDGNFTLVLRKRTGSYNVVVRDKLRRIVYHSGHVFNNAPVKISLSEVANGVYSVEVANDNERFVRQISIAR